MTFMPPVVAYVTESDLEQGMIGQANLCPVALAASRALGCPVTVGRYWVTRHDGSGLRCPTPSEAKDAILGWDRGDRIEPISFVLAGWESP